jgi:hypothetical protein
MKQPQPRAMWSGQGAADTTATKRKNERVAGNARRSGAQASCRNGVYQETTPRQEGFELYRSRMLSAIERKN